MISLPKNIIPNRLEITLREGDFNLGYLFKNNKHYSLKPESNAEKKLLSSRARKILFRGLHYKMDEDSPNAYAISQEDISESLKYTCVGYN